MRFFLIPLFLFFSLLSFCQSSNLISIDLSPGHSSSSSLFGVSLENKYNLMDGGLYAELIANGNFEAGVLDPSYAMKAGYLVSPHKLNAKSRNYSDFKVKFDTLNHWPAWLLNNRDRFRVFIALDTSNPRYSASPQSLSLKILKASLKEPLSIENIGYHGIAVAKSEEYTFRFDFRADSTYNDTVLIELKTSEGKSLVKKSIAVIPDCKWHSYVSVLKASKSDVAARLSIQFISPGKVWIDNVSLFPVKTFRKKAYGLRSDLAESIAALKPAFVRWPFGVSSAGYTYSTRFRWKETIGNPWIRKGQRDENGFLNTNRFGYFEFLQFCEDIGSSAMFVCNDGIANTQCNGDYCSDEELNASVQDALDAIEYAIGDTTSVWGAQRMKDGHSAPFPLRYIQIGQEDVGEIYQARLAVFRNGISKKFPQIGVISASPAFQQKDAVSYFSNRPIFETIFKITELGCLKANAIDDFGAALSEASFLAKLETDSMPTKFVSYFQLLGNDIGSTGQSLLQFNSRQVYKRSSYEVQKVFSNQSASIICPVLMRLSATDLPRLSLLGFLGLGTNSTHAIFSEFKVQSLGQEDYRTDFGIVEQDWDPLLGHWRFENNAYIQSDLGMLRLSRLLNRSYTNASIEFKARKMKGTQGFLFVFGGVDTKNYYQVNFGGNGTLKVEKVTNGIPSSISDSSYFSPELNRLYQCNVEIKGDSVRCFVDSNPLLRCRITPPNRRYAVARFDSSKMELEIKVINAESTVFKTGIQIEHQLQIKKEGVVEVIEGQSLTKGNSYKRPNRIVLGRSNLKRMANAFDYSFKPYSITILRLKVKPSY